MPPKKRVPRRAADGPSHGRRWLLALCGIAAVCVAVALYVKVQTDPGIKLLVSEHGARWIRRQRPFGLAGWGGTQEHIIFRKRLTVPASSGPHEVTFRALSSSDVYWDNRRIYTSDRERENWKEPHRVILPKAVTPGEHSIDFWVENNFGRGALLAYCDSLGLKTGPDWEEWDEPNTWKPVSTVDDVELPDFSRRFESPLRALASSLWWLGPLFLAVWGGLIWTNRQTGTLGLPTWWTASRCRFFVLAAWFVLAANNFSKLPAELGYDLSGHVDYIRFIAERGEIPVAGDGIQTFQSPLFYLLSAGIYRVLRAFVSGDTAVMWLRWVPLLCGMAQVEICFRTGRCVFPDRDDLQSLVVLVGGLLPMNLYMSQVVSNEPLSGVLSAVVILCGLKALREPAIAQRSRWQWCLGLVLGLGLLAKMSAVLLAPIVAVVLALTNRSRGFRGVLTAFARCFGTAAIVSGWYYGRNWLWFGQPFVGGWDPLTGILWWQDPGFRTPWQMASFGHALIAPIHAAFYSIWDGFYSTLWLDGNLSSMNSWETRPPWNQTLLLAAPWPAILLSAAVAAGLFRGLRCRDVGLRHALQFAGGSLLVYLAAFALLCLQVPAFSAAKASYTLGLTPAYAALCVAGLDLMPPHRALRSAATAFVICWSVLAYCTYFVVGA